MGFRFRKSFKILPGVRMNVGRTGTSFSIGGKGLTTNISDKGIRNTIGIPGTGISYTTYEKSSGANPTRSSFRSIGLLVIVAMGLIVLGLISFGLLNR